MPFFAMRLTAGLTTPSIVRWGTQDFAATDPEFIPGTHDQVPLRTDVAETPGVFTRHHTTAIVAPDVTLHTIQEMIQADKDAVEALEDSKYSSVLEWCVAPQEQILTANSYQNVGSCCIDLTRVIFDPSLLRMEANFAYTADGDIRFRLRAEGNAGDIDLGGGRNFPSSVAFDRVRTARSDPLPTNNGVLEYKVEARLQPAGSATTCTIRGLTLVMLEEK